jgi:hypothetical protein
MSPVAAWVAESRAAQGLPRHVEDATTLAPMAMLLAETPAIEGGGARAKVS